MLTRLISPDSSSQINLSSLTLPPPHFKLVIRFISKIKTKPILEDQQIFRKNFVREKKYLKHGVCVCVY